VGPLAGQATVDRPAAFAHTDHDAADGSHDYDEEDDQHCYLRGAEPGWSLRRKHANSAQLAFWLPDRRHPRAVEHVRDIVHLKDSLVDILADFQGAGVCRVFLLEGGYRIHRHEIDFSQSDLLVHIAAVRLHCRVEATAPLLCHASGHHGAEGHPAVEDGIDLAELDCVGALFVVRCHLFVALRVLYG